MYQYLTGRLIEKKPTEITVDVNGVGYQIHIPVSTHGALPSLGENVRILTHLVVREDAQLLYGFYTEEERGLFRLLLSVSGIGPKMGVTILSGLSLPDLKKAIVDGAIHTLTGISGIGRKTAERIVIELREKVVLEERRAGDLQPAGRGKAEERIIEDCLQALVQLGYRKPNAREAVEKVLKNSSRANLSVEELIRESLKYV